MSFSVFEKIDPSCQNGSMEKAKNIPYHQRPYASIAERTLVDISIYSPRPQIAGTGHSHSKISIHSPRAGRDCRYPNAPLITQISIHSPHTGRDRLVNAPIVSPSLFQSTLPAWGETTNSSNEAQIAQQFQSTLPAWGETLRTLHSCTHALISIHSPRMGRDTACAAIHGRNCLFQSTLPAWGETQGGAAKRRRIRFQSTLPAWGETDQQITDAGELLISIHSPRMGRDGWCNSSRHDGQISIHSPRMGRDLKAAGYRWSKNKFQSTLPAWGETRAASASDCVAP